MLNYNEFKINALNFFRYIVYCSTARNKTERAALLVFALPLLLLKLNTPALAPLL